MTQNQQIQNAALRVALQEQATAEAEKAAETARERLSALYQRRDAIAAEIASLRGSHTPGEMPDDKAARVYCLGLDSEDLAPIIDKAIQDANAAAGKLEAEVMALSVAKRDLSMATKKAEIDAVEAKVRDAEKAMLNGIAHLSKLKREAGVSIRSISDVYRAGHDFDRLMRLGTIPTVVQ